jgi:hypothetical protein
MAALIWWVSNLRMIGEKYFYSSPVFQIAQLMGEGCVPSGMQSHREFWSHSKP